MAFNNEKGAKLVTLIGEKQTRLGTEFIYAGPLVECKDCKLKGVCFNLEIGMKYRIIGIRPSHHDCKIHEEGVRAVEVEKIPLLTAVSSKAAIEGATVSYEMRECRNLGCENYRVCRPSGAKTEDKLRIVRLGNDIACPEGLKLREVFLETAEVRE